MKHKGTGKMEPCWWETVRKEAAMDSCKKEGTLALASGMDGTRRMTISSLEGDIQLLLFYIIVNQRQWCPW